MSIKRNQDGFPGGESPVDVSENAGWRHGQMGADAFR
jgi:hypothetical protein